MSAATRLANAMALLPLSVASAASAVDQTAKPAWPSGDGFSWWQAAGGTIAVFALLVLCLRLLSRLGRSGRRGDVALLAVWPLGPRREIQVLRFRDQVHYLYRQDGALVALSQEPLADYQSAAGRTGTIAAGVPWRRWRERLLPLVGAAETRGGGPSE